MAQQHRLCIVAEGCGFPHPATTSLNNSPLFSFQCFIGSTVFHMSLIHSFTFVSRAFFFILFIHSFIHFIPFHFIPFISFRFVSFIHSFVHSQCGVGQSPFPQLLSSVATGRGRRGTVETSHQNTMGAMLAMTARNVHVTFEEKEQEERKDATRGSGHRY